jgi:tetratricopeptide (TPR) repeat protein
MVPKRTRSHRVEEESRGAFKAALAERFLFRDDVPDYGIDGSVEEFDESDKATGLRYFVQLKATDGEDLGDALTRSIPIDHANFYESLPLPLLMVRYVAASGDLYVRWWHGRLPGKRPPRANAASITFHWTPNDKVVEGDSERWAEQARSFLELRSASPPLPFWLDLKIEDPPFGLTGSEIELAIKEQTGKSPDVIKLHKEKANGQLLVRGSYLAVEMPGMTASSYELGDDYNPDSDGKQLAIDLMTLIALAFARWGQVELAARMTMRYFAHSTLSSSPEAAMALASAMTSARRISEALGVAEEIDASGATGEHNTSMLFTLTSRQHSASLSKEEIEEYRQTMQRRIARREDAGESIEASRELVSLANHHRSQDEAIPAIELYERAAMLDPEYQDRAYYWHELAGVLFFADRFEESADAYGKAIELGEGGLAPLLKADALMFAGHYEEAREAFRESLTAEESFESGSEYFLKMGLLDFLIDWRGLKHQERDPQSAIELVGEVVPDGGTPAGEEAIGDRCWEALGVDGLNGLAWWNLASAVEKLGEREQAGLMFLNAALCQPWDAEAWAFAFIHLWREGRDELLPMILVTGERLTARKVLPAINTLVTQHMGSEDRGDLISKLGEMVEDLRDPRSDGFELRFVNSGQEVENMIIPGAATRHS